MRSRWSRMERENAVQVRRPNWADHSTFFVLQRLSEAMAQPNWRGVVRSAWELLTGTPMQPGTLEVHVECASELPVSLYRSTYVMVSCGAQQARSRTATGQGWEPTFNEQLRFPVDGSTSEIIVTVFNDRTPSRDEEVGSIRISLAHLFRGGCPAKIPSTAYALKSVLSGKHQGDLRLSFTYTPTSADNVQVQDGSTCHSSEVKVDGHSPEYQEIIAEESSSLLSRVFQAFCLSRVLYQRLNYEK